MKQPTKTPALARICNTISNIILILIILICGLFAVPRFFGYTEYNVVSGSMEPAIPTGSLVLVREVDPAELQVGDVIAFVKAEYEGGAVVTHRIVAIDEEQQEITTKGDANGGEDPMPITFFQVVGRVEKHIPALGYIGMYLSAAGGKVTIILMILGVALLYAAASLIEKRARE